MTRDNSQSGSKLLHDRRRPVSEKVFCIFLRKKSDALPVSQDYLLMMEPHSHAGNRLVPRIHRISAFWDMRVQSRSQCRAGLKKVSQNPGQAAPSQEMGQHNTLKSCCLRIRFLCSGVQLATILASFGVLRQFLKAARCQCRFLKGIRVSSSAFLPTTWSGTCARLRPPSLRR